MHTNKMIDFKEGAIIADDKHLLQLKYDVNNQLVGFYSNEEQDILLQEILFEKHWNDVKSLKVINSN